MLRPCLITTVFPLSRGGVKHPPDEQDRPALLVDDGEEERPVDPHDDLLLWQRRAQHAYHHTPLFTTAHAYGVQPNQDTHSCNTYNYSCHTCNYSCHTYNYSCLH